MSWGLVGLELRRMPPAWAPVSPSSQPLELVHSSSSSGMLECMICMHRKSRFVAVNVAVLVLVSFGMHLQIILVNKFKASMAVDKACWFNHRNWKS